jgi:CRP/FNR family transcriptional regulator, dissimilatory nitrate respiration regulator
MKKTIPSQVFLETLPFFAGLDREAFARLAAGTEHVDAPRGAIVYRCGDACAGLHIVVFGLVKLAIHAPEGGEKVMELMQHGGVFGESAMFLGKPHQVTAEALSDTKLLLVRRTTVLEELARNPAFSRQVIHELSQRLNTLIGDVQRCRLRSGTERVVGYLVDRIPPDIASSGDIVVTLPARKGIIASHLNLTHEHFSRILHHLARAGAIRVQGRMVNVIDLELLRGCSA